MAKKRKKMAGNQAGWINVELQVSIEASREKVWGAITKEINSWWRKDFYANPNTKSFHLEPHLGGKMEGVTEFFMQ